MKQKARLVAAAIVVAVALAGCAAEPLAEEFGGGSEQNYVSSDGTVKEVPPEQRGDAVEFSGTTESGDTLSSEDFAGSPYVVNFWFADCPPCVAEAPDLVSLSDEYEESGVRFLGVNTRDSADTALTFAEAFGIEYPSILDRESASVQVAFAGEVGANATPTTLVIDRDGRIAARISGFISDPDILSAMIDAVLAEAD